MKNESNHADKLAFQAYNLSVQNNAILRILLANQVRIMSHIGLKPGNAQPSPEMISSSVLKDLAELDNYMNKVEIIESEYHRKTKLSCESFSNKTN